MLKMKKLTVILSALMLVCAMSALSFAQTAPTGKRSEAKANILRGKITSIDTTKNEIVVKNKDGVEKTISVDAKAITTLKTDENVRIKVKEGTNVAESIREIVKTATPAKAPVK